MTNESQTDDGFESIYSIWIIDSVLDHSINASKYSPLIGSSYIKLPKELDHPRKG